MDGYDYLLGDNVFYRRRKGGGVSVDDVLLGDRWVPYAGDAFKAGMTSDRCDDPLASTGGPPGVSTLRD